MAITESSPPAAPLTVEQALNQAVTHHQAGNLPEAERLYRAILAALPKHPDASHNLGVLAVQVRQPAAGLPHFRAALEANPNQGQYWFSYIDALIQTGQTDQARKMLAQARERGLRGEAVDSLAGRLDGPASGQIKTLMSLFNHGRYTEGETLARRLTLRFPQAGFCWKVLGAMLKLQGRSADALDPLRRAAELLPQDAEAHNNLGIIFQEQGRLPEAEASYCRALEIHPGYADAQCNLGVIFQEQGRLEEAEASYCRALESNPDHAQAYYNLGVIFQEQGRMTEAEGSYRRALEINPDCAEALNGLALLLSGQGKSAMALHCIKRSLRIKETREAKRIFVSCIKDLRFTQDDKEIRFSLVRALTEPWGRPGDLARISSHLIKLNPDIGGCLTRVADTWPLRLSAQDLFGPTGLNALAADRLLCALLISAPVCDIEMERFLTMARCAMLEAATVRTASDGEIGPILNFTSALARQCYINEYVFSSRDEEIQKASDLRDSLVAALQTNTRVPDLWPIAVAAYFPLRSLPLASRLLDALWPESVTAVLVQQISEPEEEMQARAGIPRLTDIEDAVSLSVKNQYEENPYPRWIKIAPAGKAENLIVFLCQKYPHASFDRHVKSGSIDILIAGCGTGQHSIEKAFLFQGARVLAVDLSMSSLGYAKRKTRELGLTSIEYAQADLLKLGSLGRSFDVIESVGVLHHLADPWAGWQVLLSLLRPGGFMKLGLYSEVARRNIVQIRNLVADQGYGSSAEDIRRCRQYLIDLDKGTDFNNKSVSSDFFSISGCRDLLFHVQEQGMTLTGIDAFLREHNLVFLGFDIDLSVLHAYRRRFPDDRAATSLAQWQIFENENPDTFIGMYQFWIQKSGINALE